jgi:hypothetical protein
MREGKDTLEQFEEILTTWKDLRFKPVNLYLKQRDRGEERQSSLF